MQKFIGKGSGKDLSIKVRPRKDSDIADFAIAYDQIFRRREGEHEIQLYKETGLSQNSHSNCIGRVGLINSLIEMGFKEAMSVPAADDWSGQISNESVEMKVKGGMLEVVLTTHPKVNANCVFSLSFQFHSSRRGD